MYKNASVVTALLIAALSTASCSTQTSIADKDIEQSSVIPGFHQEVDGSLTPDTPYCNAGRWLRPFQHDITGFKHPPEPNHHGARFMAVHAAVIPKGIYRGKVLVWDQGYAPDFLTTPAHEGQDPWVQRWAIVDPINHEFVNWELPLPADKGDLFCAGHTWNSQGNLIAAGGIEVYGHLVAPQHNPGSDISSTPDQQVEDYVSAVLTYEYDPEKYDDIHGGWTRLEDMYTDRYYPTVIQAGNGQVVVSGGNGGIGLVPQPTYEVLNTDLTWDINADYGIPLFQGPTNPAQNIYPHLYQLSTGDILQVAFADCTQSLNHEAAPGIWTAGPCRGNDLFYPSSFLHPFTTNEVWVLGGGNYSHPTVPVSDQVFAIDADSAEPSWEARPSLNIARWGTSAVILPTGDVLVVGGASSDGVTTTDSFTRVPELLDIESSQWTTLAPEASNRGYHATALLLPDGRVLSAGADTRQYDYQVFEPPYLHCGHPRPVITNTPDTMKLQSSGGSAFPIGIELQNGESIKHVALVAPASITHHYDMNQRLVPMPIISESESAIIAEVPADSYLAPRGYYMLFVISDHGVPSEATWIKLE